MQKEEVVRIENLSFSYGGDYEVLRNVNLSIYKGEFLGIIGPNGAGKTTLLRIILGLVSGYKGSVYLFGKNVSQFREWERVGYVPQRLSVEKLHPVSVRELLSSVVRRESDLEFLIEFLHMEELLDKQFVKLSGGQQQLVLLGIALSSKPELLLLDEPTAGLDIHSQEHIMEILKSLSKEEGKTVVMVSHNLGILFPCADRIVAIDREIKYSASPKDSEKLVASIFGLHGNE